MIGFFYTSCKIGFMEIYQLKYFASIADKKSYAAAARSIRVSQPSLSIQIKRLEEELQCRLFNRTSKGISLTASGERVLQSTRRIFSELGDLRLDLDAKNLTSLPSMRIGVQPMLASIFLPDVMKGLIKKINSPRITVVERSNSLLPALLQQREVHACLMTHSSGNIPHVEIEKLATYRYSVYGKCMKGFHKQGVRLEKILLHPLLLLRDPLGMENILLSLAQKKNITPHIPFSCEHTLTLLEMAAAGLGFAILPDLLLQKSKELKLESVPLLSPSLRGDVVMIRRNDNEEHPLLCQIRDHIRTIH
jgi:LysR family hydrogen peroxide-inducible transcriptional activator